MPVFVNSITYQKNMTLLGLTTAKRCSCVELRVHPSSGIAKNGQTCLLVHLFLLAPSFALTLLLG